MRIALDTNTYTDFCRGNALAVQRIQEAERVYLPFVVVAELRAGFLCGSKALENEANFVRFLSSPRVQVLYADDGTTHHYASIFRRLRAQGTPLPTNDLWIAALVIQHGLHLFARDRHFDALPQIPRV